MNSSHFLQLYKVGIISSFFRDEETEIESTLSIVIQVIGELSVFSLGPLYFHCMHATLLQSCPALCNAMDCM